MHALQEVRAHDQLGQEASEDQLIVVERGAVVTEAIHIRHVESAVVVGANDIASAVALAAEVERHAKDRPTNLSHRNHARTHHARRGRGGAGEQRRS